MGSSNGAKPAAAEASTTKLILYVVAWYVGNTLYNVYNKKSTNSLHAHWFIADLQLLVGIVWSIVLWTTGMRKAPNLTAADITACIPIGFFAAVSHAFSVFAMGAGAVSFAQIVKASEPVFAAAVGVMVPPMEIKPLLAYLMFIPIIGGVGLACVKEGKGVDINVAAAVYACIANAGAAFKGKLGGSVTKSLKADETKNMDSANVYAVMNIISFLCVLPVFIATELPTLNEVWAEATEKHSTQYIMTNILLSGFFYYVYNEFAFAFNSLVGAVTASVLNTAKRVIIIVVSSIMFKEAMDRNTVMGSAIAIGGTFAYSIFSKHKKAAAALEKKSN